MDSNNIRSSFIEYFVRNDHTHKDSSSLIPHNDPTLLFVNSGMVQFKDVFTGHAKCEHKRVTTYQKSVRVGGKHNDLENVGYTARHHTFFEMLGNFSFGDYFKEQAIYYAWELITREWGIDKSRLYVTVYHTDNDAVTYWKKIANLSDSRIIKIRTNDNFWFVGDTGPCGPCSEIFYDHGEHIPGGLPGSEDSEGDRFVEIWNMVFMEFEQIDKQTRITLPQKCIDTGMGLERIAAVLQGKCDNYDTDLFTGLIDLIKQHLRTDHYQSYKIIADHIRSSAFLISSGVLPSNEGRGYVLRRILRRAIRHVYQSGCKEPVLYSFINYFVQSMQAAYPELLNAQNLIVEAIKYEEQSFYQTLGNGLKILEHNSSNLSAGDVLSGKVAFTLYDTYGFPLDLTQNILSNKGISVDQTEFDALMLEQKERAKKAWVGSGEKGNEKIWFELRENFGPTEFFGYTVDKMEGRILGLVIAGELLESVDQIGAEFMLISNQTVFYAESGGQKADIGYIRSKNCEAEVIDVRKILDMHVHCCVLKRGEISAGEGIELQINNDYRQGLKAHHSATHLMHIATKEVLGNHIAQKGSLVAYNMLRFDVGHFKPISPQEIRAIEDIVNKKIRSNNNSKIMSMSKQDAVGMGATALFGEKYGDQVRVVTLCDSIELCGGTHVERTGDIGLFKIISEESLASGVRRLVAVCGDAAVKYVQSACEILDRISVKMQGNYSTVEDKIDTLQTRVKSLEREIDAKIEKDIVAKLQASETEDCGIMFLGCTLEEAIPPKFLQNAVKHILQTIPKDRGMLLCIACGSVDNGGRINIFLNNIASKTIGSASEFLNQLLRNMSQRLAGSFKVGGGDTFAQSSIDTKDWQVLLSWNDGFFANITKDLLRKVQNQGL